MLLLLNWGNLVTTFELGPLGPVYFFQKSIINRVQYYIILFSVLIISVPGIIIPTITVIPTIVAVILFFVDVVLNSDTIVSAIVDIILFSVAFILTSDNICFAKCSLSPQKQSTEQLLMAKSEANGLCVYYYTWVGK
jgi:hypothetical protein